MPVDRAALVAGLEENLVRVTRAARAVPDPTRRPSGGWSVLEVVEHLVMSERGIQRLIARAAAEPPAELRTAEQADVVESVATFPGKLQAPDVIAPTGRFDTLDEALRAFREARGSTVDLAQALDVDFEAHHAPHRFFGVLDLAQWFRFLATHGDRHAAQIERLVG
jgi:hypothetical protein